MGRLGQQVPEAELGGVDQESFGPLGGRLVGSRHSVGVEAITPA